MTLEIKKAAEILRQDGLVAFPTETVYGLGARLSETAIRRIFAAKGRPFDNPLIVHIAEPNQLNRLSSDMPSFANALMAAFWPGPLTLVLKRSNAVPAIVSAGLPSIAVRMPNHPIALSLLQEFGEPIAAPSANRSGRPSPTCIQHVQAELGKQVDFILDGGPCTVGLESTVISLIDNPCILRPGAIGIDVIQSVIGHVVESSYSRGAALSSPGMKHAHYVPRLTLVLVEPRQWQTVLEKQILSGKRLGMISLKAVLPFRGENVVYEKVMTDLAHYAQNLFAAFYEAEAAGVETLLIEIVPREGLGVAIMDRLERAAAGASG